MKSCWNFTIIGIHYILQYIQIENRYLNCNMLQYYCLYCIFDQINAVLLA